MKHYLPWMLILLLLLSSCTSIEVPTEEEHNTTSLETKVTTEQTVEVRTLPVPEQFLLEDESVELGLTYTKYDGLIWFKRSTSLGDLITLMGKEPDKVYENASRKLYKYDLDDGGFVQFSIGTGGEGLKMVYPRKTSQFGLPEYPALPWQREDLFVHFGEDITIYSDNGMEFMNYDDNQKYKGLRFDINFGQVTGFRVFPPSM